ncbi:hypothetical protein NW768_001126 [Fusarium equiseti]|uniref:Uncharacterized protein n=1 Tax=Fusarium equiseti TaxID=61235 RepID=A0ABQ8RPK9_FUSEQ|nr:hypothetical protein NW768_001126 [Fusarium equiseti]
MGIGTMTFPLYIKKMPDNMRFTVTGVKGLNPHDNGDWYYHHSCPATPFTVDLNKREGYIGEFYLAPKSVTQSGQGPKFEVGFTIEGTSPTGVTSSRNGWLTISTDEWGWFARPDKGVITFVFDGSAADQLLFNTPTLTYLDDCNIVVEWLTNERAVGMTITSDKTMVKQLCEWAIGGILKGHEKAASWVVGKVW